MSVVSLEGNVTLESGHKFLAKGSGSVFVEWWFNSSDVNILTPLEEEAIHRTLVLDPRRQVIFHMLKLSSE